MTLIKVLLQEGGEVTELDESELVKRTITVDDECETTVATEYRLRTDPRAERAVHRSVNMKLKTGLFADGIAATL